MICFLVLHGKDDDTVRGGWSQSPLTKIGVEQANQLADELSHNIAKYDISKIYSSDLPRALETAEIISRKIDLPIIVYPPFRETNNGVLAGMKNDLANEKYLGIYWAALEWNEKYPNGESPCDFYNRIYNAWNEYSQTIIKNSQNVLLVTHGGVINVILSIIENKSWTNKENQERIPHATLIPIEYNNNWYRL